MTAARIAALGLFALLGSLSSFGQEKAIPFAEIAAGSKPYYANQTSTELLYSGDSSPVSSAEAGDSSSASSVTPPEFSTTGAAPSLAPADGSAIMFTRTAAVKKSIGNQFWLMNGLHLGMAMFDVAMTHQCISNHHCVEGNPMMPKSLAGQIGINLGVFGYSTFTSYRMKKHHSRRWWIAPTVGIASHSVGVASGFVHR